MQCFRCGHKWMAYVETGKAEAPTEAVLTDTRPVPDFIIRPQNHDETISLPAIPGERGMPPWLKLTLGLLILLGLVGGAGYALRDQLPGWGLGAASIAPPPSPTADITKPTQPPDPPRPQPQPQPAAASLMLENVRLELVADGGRAIMASGNIVNTGTTETAPRRIRFLFRDKDNKPLAERDYELQPDRIAPQGRQPFRQRVDDPPVGAVDVDVKVEPLS